jgi:hypothetical protein
MSRKYEFIYLQYRGTKSDTYDICETGIAFSNSAVRMHIDTLLPACIHSAETRGVHIINCGSEVFGNLISKPNTYVPFPIWALGYLSKPGLANFNLKEGHIIR